jgi:hypothetical protein
MNVRSAVTAINCFRLSCIHAVQICRIIRDCYSFISNPGRSYQQKDKRFHLDFFSSPQTMPLRLAAELHLRNDDYDC